MSLDSTVTYTDLFVVVNTPQIDFIAESTQLNLIKLTDHFFVLLANHLIFVLLLITQDFGCLLSLMLANYLITDCCIIGFIEILLDCLNCFGDLFGNFQMSCLLILKDCLYYLKGDYPAYLASPAFQILLTLLILHQLR